MIGAFQGFFVVAVIVGVGFAIGRTRLLSPKAESDLSRLVLWVLLPCLVVTMLIDARLSDIFSPLMAASLIASVLIIGLHALAARVLWHRQGTEATIGALAAGLPNVGNIGIPVSAYVLGSATFAVPVILVQSGLIMPAALVLLDVLTKAPGASAGRTLLKAVLNPVVVASVVGVLILVFGVTVPSFVVEPFRLIGAAAVPIVLIAFGISLSGQRPLAPGSERGDVILATVLKLVVMPVVAWVIGRFLFGMSGLDLLAVTLLAALPTAQNVVVIARRYGRGETIARDTALITTIGVIPILLVVTWILAP